MPRFQPEKLLRTLERHQVRYVVIGGVGATLHGSPLPTRDTDICPEPGDANLERLAAALLLNLTTAFGDLDLSFEPAGTRGYEELEPRSVRYDLGDGVVVPVAALEDIIRSKEAADRDKDRQTLPTLRLLLEKGRKRPPKTS